MQKICEIYNFVFCVIFLQFREIKIIFVKIILIFAKFEENLAEHEIKNFMKISQNYKNKVSKQPYAGLEWGGEAGQYSPSTFLALTQIAPYPIGLPFIPFSILSFIILWCGVRPHADEHCSK